MKWSINDHFTNAIQPYLQVFVLQYESGQLAYERTTHAITQLTWIPRSEVAKQAVSIQKHRLLCKVSSDGLYCPGEFTAAAGDVLAEGSVELIERWVWWRRVEIRGIALKPHV